MNYNDIKQAVKELRMKFLKLTVYRGAKFGKGCHLGSDVKIWPPGFSAGDYVYIGAHSEIAPHVHIGNYTSLSTYVSIIGSDHCYDRAGVPIIFSGRPESVTTEIGHDVLIGNGAVIMRGVKIGNGAVVGAKSVVTKDIPPYAVVTGIPAKVIRYRFNEEEIRKHEEMLSKPAQYIRPLGPPV